MNSIKTYLRILFFVLLTIVFIGPFITSSNASVIFEGDFETGNLGNFRVLGISPTATSSLSRAGTYAMKSVLNPAEKRAEVKMPSKINAVGNEYWYGFSIFLPEPFEVNSKWEVVANWHGRPDFDIGEVFAGQGAIMALTTANPRSETIAEWVLINRWDSKPNSTPGGVPDIEGTNVYEFGPYETGVWTDWVFHVKWSYESDGFLEIWKNGIKVLDRDGPNCYNDEYGPYFKMGIYRAGRSSNAPRTIYHDEFRMADADGTYEDVAPKRKSGLGKATLLSPSGTTKDKTATYTSPIPDHFLKNP